MKHVSFEPQTWQEMESLIHEIPEKVLGGFQPEALYNLSCHTKGKGEIVEIGSHVGKSAMALGFGQKCLSNGRPIHSIDIVRHPDFLESIQKVGLASYVKQHISSSGPMAQSWSLPIELLFIDGDHSSYGVLQDIRRWSPFIIPGGKIVFHDYPGDSTFFSQSNGVWKAIYREILSRPYQWRLVSDRAVGSLIVFERLCSEADITLRKKFLRWGYWLARDFLSFFNYNWPSLGLVMTRGAKKLKKC